MTERHLYTLLFLTSALYPHQTTGLYNCVLCILNCLLICDLCASKHGNWWSHDAVVTLMANMLATSWYYWLIACGIIAAVSSQSCRYPHETKTYRQPVSEWLLDRECTYTELYYSDRKSSYFKKNIGLENGSVLAPFWSFRGPVLVGRYEQM